jgi:methyl-accepting chemotaxis protein
MSSSDHLKSRLSFMRLDARALERIGGIHDVIAQALPAALDAFYTQVRNCPETSRFFSSEKHIDAAKQRQSSHWDRIAKGQFDQDYVAAVTTVGETHARIGLEPRWYIGGYALVLEKLITEIVAARWPKGRFGGKIEGADERGAEISAIVKAALLDMDYAISVYLQASETARIKAEEQARSIERAKAAEREKAVRYVSEGMAALAQGNLTFRIGHDIPEEYGLIRDNFNEAMTRLEQMVATIKASATAIAASSQEINSGAQDLSSRTEQQASALEESAATTEELAASVKTSAQASRRSVELADDATRIARTGGTIVKDATDAMARIEEASKKISEITGVIDGIAFQTNLLALNAAVEAARAGDAGRGFAVVAAEVRTLAQRSSEAAKSITGLIASSDAEVTEGVKLVRLAGDTLEQIVDASARVSATVEEIAGASGQQANGLDEMSQAVTHMDGITQQNAALAEQSAASARTLLDQIGQLNRLISSFRTQDSRVIAIPSARRAA